MKSEIVLNGIELKKFLAISDFFDSSSDNIGHNVVALYNGPNGLSLSTRSDYAVAEAIVNPVSENIDRQVAYFNIEFVKEIKKLTRLKKSLKQEFTLSLDHENRLWDINGEVSGNLEWVDPHDADELFGPNKTIYPIVGPFKPSLLKSLAIINETMGYLDEAWIIGTTMEPGEDQRILDEYGRHRATRMTAVRKDWRALVIARFRTGANSPENETAMGYSVSKS